MYPWVSLIDIRELLEEYALSRSLAVFQAEQGTENEYLKLIQFKKWGPAPTERTASKFTKSEI